MTRTAWQLAIAALLISGNGVYAQTTTNSIPYSFQERGAISFIAAGGSNVLTTGYARIQPNVGNTTPTAVALVGFRANGTLVSEAGIPGVVAMTSGRTYAEVNGAINTGIAIANPNSLSVTVSFSIVNSSGTTVRQGSVVLAANTQVAAFLDQSPFSASNGFAGAFSFDASAPVGVIALRSSVNANGEFLMTTQSVAPATSIFGNVVLGHFADGGGWKTRVLLVNTTDSPISGSVQFFGQGSGVVPATPLTMAINGQVSTTFSYTIPARASAKLETEGANTITRVGSVRITPSGGNASPSAFAEFVLLAPGGIIQTQASVQAQQPAITFRTYVESNRAAVGGIRTQSGIAMTNTSTTTATVALELFNVSGTSTGLTTVISIPGSGHVSMFLHELFPTVPQVFQGVLRGHGGTTPIAAVVFRTRYNEVGRFLMTTMPVSNEASSSNTAELMFPQIAFGGDYTTQFVLFSGIAGQSSSDAVRLFDRSGQPLPLTVN